MRKIILYTSIGIALLLVINIINILSDLSRLTNYGYGYLAGKVILLLIFVGIIFFLKKYKTNPEK